MGKRTRSFSHYDSRNYETHDVVAGYARWAPVYDDRMDRRLDLDLFDRCDLLNKVVPGAHVIDLACGTGRVGAWLRSRGADLLWGVDLSADMMAQATGYDELIEADICNTHIERTFDLATTSMALCHVPDLAAFFSQARQLVRPAGLLFVVDFHPFFLMRGVPTHFDDPQTGVPQAVQDHVHPLSEYIQRAHDVGFSTVDVDERFVDDAWVAAVPGFAKHVGWPVTVSFAFERSAIG